MRLLSLLVTCRNYVQGRDDLEQLMNVATLWDFRVDRQRSSVAVEKVRPEHQAKGGKLS